MKNRLEFGGKYDLKNIYAIGKINSMISGICFDNIKRKWSFEISLEQDIRDKQYWTTILEYEE